MDTITVTLSPGERLERGIRLAQLESRIDAMRDEAAKTAAQWRDEIKATEDQRKRLAAAVRTGTEERPAQVDLPLDRDRGEQDDA